MYKPKRFDSRHHSLRKEVMWMSKDKRDRQKRRRHMPITAFANRRQTRKLRLRDGGGNTKQTRPVWWVAPPTRYNDGLYGPIVNPPKL
jgi:hypothetical protein